MKVAPNAGDRVAVVHSAWTVREERSWSVHDRWRTRPRIVSRWREATPSVCRAGHRSVLVRRRRTVAECHDSGPADESGQSVPVGSGMLKSCGCDAMTGAGGSFLGWGSESKERNGLGRSAQGRCAPVGKPGRNTEFSVARRYLDESAGVFIMPIWWGFGLCVRAWPLRLPGRYGCGWGHFGISGWGCEKTGPKPGLRQILRPATVWERARRT